MRRAVTESREPFTGRYRSRVEASARAVMGSREAERKKEVKSNSTETVREAGAILSIEKQEQEK